MNWPTNLRLPWLGLGACVVCGSSSLASADTPSTEIEEIIVTAQRRPEPLADVPMSLNVITGDRLAQEGVSSVGGLSKFVPGFTFTQTPYGAPILTIRGIGFFDEAVGIAPTVSVYVDQILIPFPRAAEGVSLDVERVEVLKGPQGTLFGQNATGGAINYVANKPTNEFTAGGELSYGRFNDVDGYGFVSGPLSDRVTARLAVRAEHRDGWQQSTSRNDELGVADFNNARLTLDWRAADTLTLVFTAQ